MFGLFSDFQPKFAKRFRDAGAEIVLGLKEYASEVSARAFPTVQHSFNMLAGEEEKLRLSLDNAHISTVVAPQSTSSKRKIAVIGGGAMGSLFAARLALRSQNDVWIVSEWQEHIEAINRDGLELRSLVTPNEAPQRVRRLRATASPSDVVKSFGGPADLALIMVKSGQTDIAALKAADVLGASPRNFALTLQNGLGNVETLAARLGAHRVLQGITSHGAMMVAAGIVEHTGTGFLTLASPTGILLGSNHPSPDDTFHLIRAATKSTAALLSDAGFQVDCPPKSIESLVWGKLIVNSVINPLTAMMGVKNGDLLQNPEALYVIHKAVDEACTVARARGVELPWTDPFETVIDVIRKTSHNKSSMLQDVMRGQMTEIDAINGAIVQEAQKHGIDAFVNRAILNCLLHGQFRPDPAHAARLAAAIAGASGLSTEV
jgi:2-dehydropantoate 2-reductase